jgi:hypothetical protein
MNEFGTLLDFNDLFRHEISIINDRRKRKTLAQAPIVLQNERAIDSTGDPILLPMRMQISLRLGDGNDSVCAANFPIGEFITQDAAGNGAG